MTIGFTKKGWEDFSYWLTEDIDTAKKIARLLEAVRRDPFRGIGKPEALRGDLRGFWSRRINQEHRLVYKVSGKKGEDQRCVVVQCRFHY